MKTLVAMPCMDMVHTRFLKSVLYLRPVGDVVVGITEGTLVDVARNQLAKQAVDFGCDRILWLDSDMMFPPELLEVFTRDLDEGRDFVGGLYYTRRGPFHPVIYDEIKIEKDGNGIVPSAHVYEDYPKDSIFRVSAIGFGAVLMTTKLLINVAEKFGSPFERLVGFGEDLSFCMKAAEIGADLWCDSRVKLHHVAYYPVGEDNYARLGE